MVSPFTMTMIGILIIGILLVVIFVLWLWRRRLKRIEKIVPSDEELEEAIRRQHFPVKNLPPLAGTPLIPTEIPLQSPILPEPTPINPPESELPQLPPLDENLPYDPTQIQPKIAMEVNNNEEIEKLKGQLTRLEGELGIRNDEGTDSDIERGKVIERSEVNKQNATPEPTEHSIGTGKTKVRNKSIGWEAIE